MRAETIADKIGLSNAFKGIERRPSILRVRAYSLRFFVSFGLPRNLIEKGRELSMVSRRGVSVPAATGRGNRIWAFWMARRSR